MSCACGKCECTISHHWCEQCDRYCMEIDEKFACLASLEYMCRHCGHITKVSTLPEEGK